MNHKELKQELVKESSTIIKIALGELEKTDRQSSFINMREQYISELETKCNKIFKDYSLKINPEIKIVSPLLGRETNGIELLTNFFHSEYTPIRLNFTEKVDLLFRQKFLDKDSPVQP